MKTFLLFLLSIVVLCSCSKTKNDCTPNTPQSEQGQIQTFASASGINATAHSSGLYYEVVNPGSGTTPNISSRIYVKYIGKLMNGTIFDSTSNYAATGWTLADMIKGWQVGLPLIQKGGSVNLIVPSSMAYGCESVGPIAPNSVLFFHIDLVDVQ